MVRFNGIKTALSLPLLSFKLSMSVKKKFEKKNIIGNYHKRIEALSNSLMNILSSRQKLARTLICSLWPWSETHLLQWQSCFVRIILHLLARLKWTVKMTIKSMNRIVNDIWIVWTAQKHPLCYMFVILLRNHQLWTYKRDH